MRRMMMFNAIVLVLSCRGVLAAGILPSPEGDTDSEQMLLGPVDLAALTSPPYQEWYEQEYNGYSPDTLVLDLIKGTVADVQITIFLGTWCPDSRREVPRFIKLMEYLNYPAESITLITLDRGKHSPDGGEEGFDIRLVPTFIFYRDSTEVGRIIEKPENSLEDDLLDLFLE
ncbi:MAG: thioredoxin family protein [Candidatus Neomarinimicrobiota bacterium]